VLLVSPTRSKLLFEVYIFHTGKSGISRSVEPSKREETAKTWLRLLGSMPLDGEIIHALLEFDFEIFNEFRGFELNFNADGLYTNVSSLRDRIQHIATDMSQLPRSCREKIIVPYSRTSMKLIKMNPKFSDCCQLYILGRRNRRIICMIQPEQGCRFCPFESFVSLLLRDCHSWIRRRR
jgi:hypothetical protein